MTKQPKLRVHRCRREFLAVKEELFSLYKEGYSIRAIREHFTGSKKITMAYTSFTMLEKEPDNPKPFWRSKNAENPSEPKQPLFPLTIHGKGGGKSFIASLLTQHLLGHQHSVACFDTDPVNETSTAYQTINVLLIDSMEGDNINSRLFDKLFTRCPKYLYCILDFRVLDVAGYPALQLPYGPTVPFSLVNRKSAMRKEACG